MPFTGKATYSAGADLPELAEDISDIIGIVSPFETPLLDHLGDPKRPTLSTVHEWVEDALLPNVDQINQTVFSPNATTATAITVDNGARFQVGDQLRPDGSAEVLFVTAVAGNVLTVIRAYGGTTGAALSNDQKLFILGNAAIEGADAPAARFTNRVRKQNWTQIFTAAAQVAGSMQAVRTHGITDELDYQKQERMRELLRDLENCVINGSAPATGQTGSASTRRTMNGIIRQIATNIYTPGVADIPAGTGAGNNELTEPILNTAMRFIWEQAASRVDTIVVGGFQKRRINSFVGSQRQYAAGDERFSNLVSIYESDFGICRVVVSRWMPAEQVLLLDSSRIDVMPLAGRSFHFKPLAASGDAHSGQVIGEYTLEFKNENAHGLIKGLANK